MIRRSWFALALTCAVFLSTAPATADCAKAASYAPRFVPIFQDLMQDQTVVPADIRAVPFAVQNVAWASLVFTRAAAELAQLGIQAPTADERCLRDAVFATPEAQATLQKVVNFAGGPVRLQTTYCPSDPSFNYAFVDAARLAPLEINLSQSSPPGWSLYFQPNFAHPLERVTLQSQYNADAKIMCHYQGGWVQTRPSVKCRPLAGSGFAQIGSEQECTGNAQRCVMECAP